MATKYEICNAVEFKFNTCCGKCAKQNGGFFYIRFQARRLNYFFNCLFSLKHSSRYWVFHYLYERQRRGLYLSPILRAFEGNTILTCPGNASDFSINGRLEQEKGDKPKDEGYGGPNEKVGHICMANVGDEHLSTRRAKVCSVDLLDGRDVGDELRCLLRQPCQPPNETQHNLMNRSVFTERVYQRLRYPPLLKTLR